MTDATLEHMNIDDMLDPTRYRSIEGDKITRENVDALLDGGLMQVHVGLVLADGMWLKMRRGGRTRKWKKTPERIELPYKYAFNGYGLITASDFK